MSANYQEIAKVNLDTVRSLPEYPLVTQLVQGIQAAWLFVADHPRWSSWFDQASRSSTSILANIAEAFGKSQGHLRSCFLVARGEAFETWAHLQTGPEEITVPLRPIVEQLVDVMNERIRGFRA